MRRHRTTARCPGGRWLEIDPRTVELVVPLDATVAPALVGVSDTAYRQYKAPIRVAAHTIEATATPEAIVGAAGALQLSRISPLP